VIPGTKTPTLDSQLIPNAQFDEKWVYGVGANPVGLQMNFRRGKRLQPLWDFEGGFLYFSQRVLAAEGSQFQFTVATGPGAQFFFTPRTALTVGYRYHHMSNANISNRNPGTDTNQLYFSFSLFR
jgi:opacity protein-like surface antigen